MAAWITDNKGFSVSESTVYRILRREGLVKSPEMQLKAGKEYYGKTTGPHQMWATDASYFKVIGWGYYYMVTVMDDYSRFIIAHKLQRDMTSDSFIEVVQDAVDRTGMTEVPVADRTKLLSDNGSGYVSRAFGDYLRLVGIRHILATSYHPQTNGKLERYHQTIKRDVNQVPYELPSDLDAAIASFVSCYNYRRYHMALGNVLSGDSAASDRIAPAGSRHPPHRTGRAPFKASGSPSDGLDQSREHQPSAIVVGCIHPFSGVVRSVPHPPDCPPSPCGRLSRPQTTTGALPHDRHWPKLAYSVTGEPVVLPKFT